MNSHAKIFHYHDVDHLSVSTINLFIDSPALCLMKLMGIKDETYKPSAYRGLAIEKGMTELLENPSISYEDLGKIVLDEFDENVTVPDDTSQSIRISDASPEYLERVTLYRYFETGFNFYKKLNKKPVESQGRIEHQMEGIDVPFIGYYDLLFDDSVRDIKTVGQTTRKAKLGHIRQIGLYGKHLEKIGHLDYISKNQANSFTFYKDDILEGYKQLEIATHSLRNLLGISSDLKEICQFVYPNYDSFLWTDYLKNEAKQIWGKTKNG